MLYVLAEHVFETLFTNMSKFGPVGFEKIYHT
jgi:hypothetical protein